MDSKVPQMNGGPSDHLSNSIQRRTTVILAIVEIAVTDRWIADVDPAIK